MDDLSSPSRRRVLGGLTAGAVALAGCSSDGESTPGGSDGSDEPTEGGGTATEEPTPTPVAERLDAPVKGDPEADVTLAVYEDYACPHCADYNTEGGLAELESAYLNEGAIRYEHRDAPIPVADPGSWQAASAAREVQARHGTDAFWSYAHALFENYGELSGNVEPLFVRLANDLDLDGAEAIATAGVNRIHEETVRADRGMAGDVDLRATPGFVLNGEVVTTGYGPDTVPTVKSAVDQALSESA
jgi:protein-disulfide isomerase